jgi:hypothetical protein
MPIRKQVSETAARCGTRSTRTRVILRINQRSEGHASYATRPFTQYIRRGHIEAAAVTVLTAGERDRVIGGDTVLE